MKTSIKQRIGFLLLVTTLVYGNPLYAKNAPDYITVNGVVRDAKTKKRLEYVNVMIPGTTVGTVTNIDGEFSIKINKELEAEKVEISHIGYRNTTLKVDEPEKPSIQVIELIPIPNLLHEIIIRPQNPRQLVLNAIDKIADNYSPTHDMLTAFYRETAQKGRKYINVSEAIMDVYKTPYSEKNEYDQVRIHKGRSLLSQKKSDTLIVKLIGGPNLSIYLDVVKSADLLLDPDILPCYFFRMEQSVMINNRPQYVVSFTPQMILPYALYYGLLYIDQETLAFTRAEFSLDMSDSNKATQDILRKKPFGLRFKPNELSFLITYNQRNGQTYLNYVRSRVRFKCDWKKKLFSTNYTVVSEMVVTDTREEKGKTRFDKKSFNPTHAFSEKVSDFTDDDFWENYNIIEPTESLESAVNKLRKQR